MFTLYNVCSVNWGIFSTSGDVQYMGDTMCTSGDVQYIREIPLVHWGGGGGGWEYHEYIGGCLAHQRDIMTHLGESNLINPFNFY